MTLKTLFFRGLLPAAVAGILVFTAAAQSPRETRDASAAQASSGHQNTEAVATTPAPRKPKASSASPTVDLVPIGTSLISNSNCPSGQAYSSGCMGPSNNSAGGCCAVKDNNGAYTLRE